ncbi:hypothetical protein [Winogradskyella sediminis]|uniref:hypothetical protein n=1 Tax=Winogradskyella sediminis TaxID=1382466 RepID=UPI0012FD4803|nr:hypothetical protein [Winogradskyella sediminis]
MKKTRKRRLSTDYFFEALYGKTKTFLFSNIPSKLATLKVLAIIAWFKDIN